MILEKYRNDLVQLPAATLRVPGDPRRTTSLLGAIEPGTHARYKGPLKRLRTCCRVRVSYESVLAVIPWMGQTWALLDSRYAMRPDMAKVIVERPRIGSRIRGTPKGYCRAIQRMADDGPPRCEGMKRRHKHNIKYLSEHLGPLRRYLDAQVGRPWDKVFSEICAHIDRSSAVQDHVRDHVADYVVTHVVLIDGVACSGDGDRNYGVPLSRIRWGSWYVCPRTGILRRIKTPVRSRRSVPKPDNRPRFVRVSDTLQCRLIDGAWHLLSLKRLPLVREGRAERDVFLDREIATIDFAMARKHYGADVYAAGKRRLARRELTHFPIPVDLWT
jgi:hypothetical protein